MVHLPDGLVHAVEHGTRGKFGFVDRHVVCGDLIVTHEQLLEGEWPITCIHCMSLVGR